MTTNPGGSPARKDHTMSDVNVPLLQQVLDHITAHPETWDQGAWARRDDLQTDCGTAFCLAGHAVVMTGHEPRWDSSGFVAGRLTDGRWIEDVAVEQLGLEPDGGCDCGSCDTVTYSLFTDTNSLADLWRIAGELTDGAIQAPATLP